MKLIQDHSRMSAWGGRREGAGRPLGSVSKNAAELKALAQEFGPSAIQRLALMAGLLPDQPGAETHAAQIAAIKELLDSGYGRATQPIASDENGTTITMLHLTAARAIPADLGRAPVTDASPEDAARDAPQLAELLSAPPLE